ncbi:MAG: tetratricopeptide repeat protein [Phycisphaerae bacterium]|nr:tetratricopeptide repeat protein [Phycisphaerae bacterium]
MMIQRSLFGWVAVALTLAAGGLAARTASAQLSPREIKTIRQPQFDIDYQLGDSRASTVELWYTDDKSQTWKLYGTDADRISPVSFTAPHEGLYGFTVIARNKAGASAPNPGANTEPMFWCFVDWHRPQVQITGPVPTVALDGSGAGQVVIKPGEALTITYTAVDDNLIDKPIRIEYRLANDTAWKDIAVNQPNTGRYLWNVPDSVSGPFLLRVTAVDQAGNVGPASTLREMEIVRRTEPARVVDVMGKHNDTTPTVGPSDPSIARTTARGPVEPPASMPDWPSMPTLGPAVGVQQPVLPPVAPKIASAPLPDLPPVPMDPPHVEPKHVGPTGDIIAPPTIVTDQDALGMFVLQYTAPEPQPAAKLEGVITKMSAAMQPLIAKGMIAKPIGVALQPVPDSVDLVKVIKVYAVIPPANRKPEQVALMEQMVQQNVGAIGGSVMTRFEKSVAPTPTAVDEPAGTRVADVRPKTPAIPSVKDERLTPADSIVGKTKTVPLNTGVSDNANVAVKPQGSANDPSAAAGGRQEVELKFGRDQRDLHIDAPPAPPPVPTGTGLINTAPKIDAPAPVTSNAHAPAPTDTIKIADASGGRTFAGTAVPPEVTQPTQPPALPTTAKIASGGADSIAPPNRIRPVDPAANTGTVTAPIEPTKIEPVAKIGPTIAPVDPAPARPAIPGPDPRVTGVVTASGPGVSAPPIDTVSSAKLAAAQVAFKNGQAAYSAGDRAKAEACYKDALANDPEMVEALINLAGLQTLAKNYPDAELNYQRAANLQPSQSQALFGLARVQLLQGKQQLAKGNLERVIRLGKADAAVYVLYGDASIALNEPTQAVAAWKEAVRLAPATPIGKIANDRLVRYGAKAN